MKHRRTLAVLFSSLLLTDARATTTELAHMVLVRHAPDRDAVIGLALSYDHELRRQMNHTTQAGTWRVRVEDVRNGGRELSRELCFWERTWSLSGLQGVKLPHGRLHADRDGDHVLVILGWIEGDTLGMNLCVDVHRIPLAGSAGEASPQPMARLRRPIRIGMSLDPPIRDVLFGDHSLSVVTSSDDGVIEYRLDLDRLEWRLATLTTDVVPAEVVRPPGVRIVPLEKP